MFIILHCRVLFVLFWYIFLVYLLVHLPYIFSFRTAFIGSPCCNACLPPLSQFIPVQLTAEPMCSRYRTENKTYQHLIPKAVLFSLLSTTVDPEHEPFLPNGVANPWQPKSGTQCGDYGQWTGPYTYQCNAELLGDIASHPEGRQYHQLAHVSWPAGSWQHKLYKKLFLSIKEHLQTYNIYSEADRLTSGSACNAIPYTSSAVPSCARGLVAQLPLGDTVTYLATIHSIPRGNMENEGNPTEEREVRIQSQDGLAAYRERCFQNPLELEKTTAWWTSWNCQGQWTLKLPGALNSDSTRGTEHLWCHGHV